METGTFY